jgi:hypothetical protein
MIREVEQPAQSHTAQQRQSQNLNRGSQPWHPGPCQETKPREHPKEGGPVIRAMDTGSVREEGRPLSIFKSQALPREVDSTLRRGPPGLFVEQVTPF